MENETSKPDENKALQQAHVSSSAIENFLLKEMFIKEENGRNRFHYRAGDNIDVEVWIDFDEDPDDGGAWWMKFASNDMGYRISRQPDEATIRAAINLFRWSEWV